MSDLLTCATRGGASAKAVVVDTLSTQDIRPRQSVEYWNDIACNTFTPQSVDPLERPFRAAIHRATVGEMRVALALSTASMITRSRQRGARARGAGGRRRGRRAGAGGGRREGRE